MRYGYLLKILLLLLGFVALTMSIPLAVAVVYQESAMIPAFAIPMAIGLALAIPAWAFTRKRRGVFTAGDGSLLVFLAWVCASLLGAVPYGLSGSTNSVTDSIFESVCGFATTGITSFADIEILPRSLLFWRAMTFWFGGMGIVVFTVALLPLLGAGGFQLIKAESPGPDHEKVAPKITATAKILWLVYIGLTLIQTVLLMLGGMGWFDALLHSFTTMGTGGVSTKNASVGHFNSAYTDGVITVFMLMAGVNFNLYYRLLKGKLQDIIHNTEAKVYAGIFLAASLVITAALVPVYGSAGRALRYGAFQTASILTTSGFTTADYQTWPSLAQGVLFCLMFVGGCSASTAGGIKVIRHVILMKQAGNEMRKLLYARGVFTIQLNKKVGRKDVVYGVAGFFSLYMAVVAAAALIIAASGLDLFSSFSMALSAVGNVGIGFGAAGPGSNYAAAPDYVKWTLSFAMIAGRLELWTVFVLCNPEYWRR